MLSSWSWAGCKLCQAYKPFMLEVISSHNVWMFSPQLSTPPALRHIPLNRRPEAPEATVKPVNTRFMLHDVATRWEEPQSVFISELSGRLCCVNGTIGLTGASCCHASVEKDIIETRLFDTAHFMTSVSLPVGSVTVAFCVCRCSKCLVMASL